MVDIKYKNKNNMTTGYRVTILSSRPWRVHNNSVAYLTALKFNLRNFTWTFHTIKN